jgi:hypothetical protein
MGAAVPADRKLVPYSTLEGRLSAAAGTGRTGCPGGSARRFSGGVSPHLIQAGRLRRVLLDRTRIATALRLITCYPGAHST